MYTAEEDAQAQSIEPGDTSGLKPGGGSFGAKRAVWILTTYGVSSIGIAFALGLSVQLYVLAVSHKVQNNDPTTASALGSVSTLLAAAIAWRMARRSFPAGAGEAFQHTLGIRPAPAAKVLFAALGGLALFVAVGLPILHIFPPPPALVVNNLAAISTKPGWPRLVWAFYTVAVSPASEELMFRGVLFAGLARSISRDLAAAITTLAFVLIHVWGLTAYPPALVPISLLGAATQWSRISTRSLLPGFVLHLVYNLAGVVAASI